MSLKTSVKIAIASTLGLATAALGYLAYEKKLPFFSGLGSEAAEVEVAEEAAAKEEARQASSREVQGAIEKIKKDQEELEKALSANNKPGEQVEYGDGSTAEGAGEAEGVAGGGSQEGQEAVVSDGASANQEESGAEKPGVSSENSAGDTNSGGNKEDAAEGTSDQQNIVVSLGKTTKKNVPVIRRYDDDEARFESPSDISGSKPAFFRGGRIERQNGREESIRYVYLSRGAWVVRNFQPYIDQIGVEVLRAEMGRDDIVAGYTEMVRTYAYLCMLLLSDEPSPRQEKAIARAIASHRQAISNLRLVWTRKSENVANLFEAYIKETFFENLNKDAIKIPAGAFSATQYQTLKQTYPEMEKEEETGIPNPFSTRKK